MASPPPLTVFTHCPVLTSPLFCCISPHSKFPQPLSCYCPASFEFLAIHFIYLFPFPLSPSTLFPLPHTPDLQQQQEADVPCSVPAIPRAIRGQFITGNAPAKVTATFFTATTPNAGLGRGGRFGWRDVSAERAVWRHKYYLQGAVA